MLYDKIRQRRLELNMSQDELASRLGYKSRSSINKIELGKNDIPQSKIAKFAKALDTTTAYLLSNDDNKRTPADPILSEGEKALIDLFRRVPAESQQMVYEMIRTAVNNLK